MPNVKRCDLDPKILKEWVSYNPDTGIFHWKKSPSRNLKVGDVAGTFKKTRSKGKEIRYRYICLSGYEMTAGRVAWALTHGVWPEGNILCKDGDTSNLRLDNLVEAMFKRTVIHENGLKKFKMSREAQRHYGLKRYYGLTLEQYTEMLNAQKGVCAICEEVETFMVKGEPKPLSVDHCHDTGKIRGILCSNCNMAVGLLKNSPQIMRAAAIYIETRS